MKGIKLIAKRFAKMRFVALFALLAGLASITAAGAGWAAYVRLAMQDESVKAAGIYGLDGGIWGEEGIKASQAEAKALAAGVKDPDAFRSKGIVIGGAKYLFLRQLEDSTVIGRKGPASIFVTPTKKAFVVVVTRDGANPGNVKGHLAAAKAMLKAGF